MEKSVYHQAVCDFCGGGIVGVRYKCINCENYDLCEECFLKGVESKNENHDQNSHVFIKSFFELKSNSDLGMLKDFIGKVCVKEKIVEQEVKVEEKLRDLHDFIICDNCESTIVGRRFSCLNCEYDFCEECEKKKRVHKIGHIFMITPPHKIFEGTPPRLKNEESVYKKMTLVEKIFHIQKFDEMEKKENEKKEIEKDSKKIVRDFTIEDLEDIVEIEKRSFSFPYDYNQFYHMLTVQKKSTVYKHLLCEISGKKSGYVVISVKSKWKNFENRVIGTVVSLAVSPDFRRMGVGNCLMTEALKFFKSNNCHHVNLQVSVVNKSAQKLYFSFGFKTKKWLVSYFTHWEDGKEYSDGDHPGDALKMTLFLK